MLWVCPVLMYRTGSMLTDMLGNIDALWHCGSQAARVRFLLRAAAVFGAAYTIRGADYIISCIPYSNDVVMLPVQRFHSEPFQSVIECLGAKVIVFTPIFYRHSAVCILTIHHLPVLQPYLCLCLCYIIHSNQLHSGLWTSQDFFRISLSLLEV